MIKEINYHKDLAERLEQKINRIDFARSVIFEVTYRCNLHCQHCYIAAEKNRRELTTQEVKSIFKQLVDAGCLHLTLSGGEPLLREDIFSLMDYGRRIGLFMHLFTNGTLITPSIADKLKELKLISLEISFHSLKKGRFDGFTGIKGSYDKVREVIELLRQRKIKFVLKITVTKENFDELKDLKMFVRDLKAIPGWGTNIIPKLDGSKDNQLLRLTPEQAVEVDCFNAEDIPLAGAVKDCPANVNCFNGNLFPCEVGREILAISPYGELKPCVEFPSTGYSILDGNLKEGWEKVKSLVASFKPNSQYKCVDCKLRDYCASCPIRAKQECGDMNACPDFYRRIADLTVKGNLS